MIQLTAHDIFKRLKNCMEAFQAQHLDTGHLASYLDAAEFGLAYDEVISILLQDKPVVDGQIAKQLGQVREWFGTEYAGLYPDPVESYLAKSP